MKVSVIIPCYNVEQYISGCIESVINQQYKNIEIIVVDNNSSDGTLMKLYQIQSKYPSKIRIYQEFKPGAAFARNTGLLHSKGEWLQFLDADDRLFPAKILNQLKTVGNNADFIISPYYSRLSSGLIKKHLINPNIWIGLAKGEAGITSSLLFKKNFFEKGYLWNTAIENHMEYRLMLDWIKNGATYCILSTAETFVIERTVGSITIDQVHCFPKNRIEIILEIEKYLNENYSEFIAEFKLETQSKLFQYIREIYKYDRLSAKHFFRNQNFNRGFLSKQRSLYKILFSFFGFNVTEETFTFMRKVKSSFVK